MSSPDVIGVKVDFDVVAFMAYTEKQMDAVLAACGQVLTRDIKLSFTSQQAAGANRAVGEIYVKGYAKSGRARIHQASAPDQPPAVDTGRLRASIATFYDRARKVTYVGTPVQYAAPLEFGTARMAPRPYFRPAVAKYYGNNRLMETVVADLKRKGIL